ncbi:MAG: hypothetical protein KF797_06750 [Flavobacteriales bacterium]|nr:hypothetical protein [Flavobacteriales bacterium]
MRAIDLHSEIIDMVKRTGDVSFLTWLRNVLRNEGAESAQDADMLEMAQRSEEAIERGEVYTHEEALAYLKAERKKREGR